MNRAQRMYEAIEQRQVAAVFEHLWAALGRTERQAEQLAWLADPLGPLPFEMADLVANASIIQEALFRSMGRDQPAIARALSALEAHMIQHGHLRAGLADFPLFHIEHAVSEGSAAVISVRLTYEDPATLGPLVTRACQRGDAAILDLVRPYATAEALEEAHMIAWTKAHPHALIDLLGPDPLGPAERLMRLIEAQSWAAVDTYASAPACPLELAQAAVQLLGHRGGLPRGMARVRQQQLQAMPGSAHPGMPRRRA